MTANAQATSLLLGFALFAANYMQRVAYLVTRFSPYILALEHIDVYASGDQCIAEVDIVLSAVSHRPSHLCENLLSFFLSFFLVHCAPCSLLD